MPSSTSSTWYRRTSRVSSTEDGWQLSVSLCRMFPQTGKWCECERHYPWEDARLHIREVQTHQLSLPQTVY